MIKKQVNTLCIAAAGLLCATGLQGQTVASDGHTSEASASHMYTAQAKETLASIQQHYAVPDGKQLLRETYPFDDAHKADYLGGGENQHKANPYAYLWPFSGSLSAYVALLEQTGDESVRKHIDQVVLPGLENYYDQRTPSAYASYINSAAPSDRFYDDNVWLGIDFTDLYLQTKDQAYLDKAVEIWQFVASGMDDKLGGGIYWCEQKKESKNTCSNAPSIVYLMKLYEATKSQTYLDQAAALYEWTKSNLQDPQDKVYWDNINLAGKIEKTKYPYNTGQMIQAAALLYKHTSDKKYLQDAQASAEGGYTYFFSSAKGSEFPRLKESNNWFIAVMLRGYVELYHQDQDDRYLQVFRSNLDHAWKDMRSAEGLFGKNWTAEKRLDKGEKEGNHKEGNDKGARKKWLLDQFAIAEMYARLAQ